MNEKEKKYILDNSPAKSIGQMAKDLDIRESKIRKFLEKQKKKSKSSDSKKTSSGRTSKRAALVSILLIIVIGFIFTGFRMIKNYFIQGL